MSRILRAAILSTLIVGAASVVMYTGTPAAILPYIFVMLPLGAIDDSGVVDIGEWVNGFFVPTPTGYAIGAMIYWFALFLFIYLTWKTSKPPKQVRERHW